MLKHDFPVAIEDKYRKCSVEYSFFVSLHFRHSPYRLILFVYQYNLFFFHNEGDPSDDVFRETLKRRMQRRIAFARDLFMTIGCSLFPKEDGTTCTREEVFFQVVYFQQQIIHLGIPSGSHFRGFFANFVAEEETSDFVAFFLHG